MSNVTVKEPQRSISPRPNASPQFDKEVIVRYLRVVWNRRWLILGIFIVSFAVGWYMASQEVPIYEAKGTINIEPARQQIVTGVESFSSSDQGSYDAQLIQKQLDLLESRMMARRVINKLRLWEYPEFAMAPATTEDQRERQWTNVINRFLAGLEVGGSRDDAGKRIITVYNTSTNPRLAAEILNTLFQELIEYNREANTEVVESAAQWLTQQIAEAEKKASQSKEALLEYQQNTELVYMGTAEQNPALQRLSTLNAQLAQAESERINAQILYQQIRDGGIEALMAAQSGGPQVESLPGQANETAANGIQVNDQILTGLKQQRTQLEAQLNQQRTIFKEGSPPIVQLQKQLAQVDSQIEQAEQSLLKNALTAYRRAYEIAEERVRALNQAINKERTDILTQNRDVLQFDVLKSEAEANGKQLQMLSDRLRDAGLMRSLTPQTNIRVIDRAEIPLGPSNSSRQTLLMGALLGLALGVGLALALDFLDDSVKTVDDVETQLRLPSLGFIPRANGQNGRSRLPRKQKKQEPAPVSLITTENGNPMFAEAYRTLRTTVLVSSADRPPCTLVITSSEARAGKTTTSINTAIALAQAGKRVLLVDGDLRHPSCARIFDIDNTVGLSTLLSSDSEALAIVHDCGVPGLDLLPSGPAPPNPSEFLSSSKPQDLIDSVTAQYDHVIIDTPPLALVSDALILSSLVDGVILVARADESSRRGVLRAKDALSKVDARILGVVLNAVELGPHQYGYYGYGNGYYGYQKKQMPDEQKQEQKV